ncbi:MAG: hypothetical protein M3S32_03125, partial [Acidobacteriota bacterium]|nr:hypothetical protein [Acidobacteriota bacterium]
RHELAPPHRRAQAEPSPLSPVFENVFEAEDLGVIVFEKDASGRVTGFRIGVGDSAIRFSPRPERP